MGFLCHLSLFILTVFPLGIDNASCFVPFKDFLSCGSEVGGSREYEQGMREEVQNLLEARGKGVVMSVYSNDVKGRVDEVRSPLPLCTILPQEYMMNLPSDWVLKKSARLVGVFGDFV